MSESIRLRMEKRILERPEQTVWVMNDFDDIASNKTASKTLSRMEETGFLKKVMQGVFCRLRDGVLPPAHEVASALARSNRHVIVPCGETVLHLMGIKKEKPEMWTYLTDGGYRTYRYGNILIEFRHASEKVYASFSQKTAWLVQAVKALGKEKKDKAMYDSLMGDFSPVEKKTIRAEIRGAAAWIRKTLLQMLDDGSDTVEENQ